MISFEKAHLTRRKLFDPKSGPVCGCILGSVIRMQPWLMGHTLVIHSSLGYQIKTLMRTLNPREGIWLILGSLE